MDRLSALSASLRTIAHAPVPTGALQNAVDTAVEMTKRSVPAVRIVSQPSGGGVVVTVAGPPVRTTNGYVHPAVVFRTALNRMLPDIAEQTAVLVKESL